ncbi:hypothetical protein [Sphingobium sp. Leaf26]|uniref:hypothetical protein n=1 Tax=Sphingobium sp. Leaf26 TaxID=1735693 RepID=UPI000B16EB4E|nr:hypothetical protein [Sphingobium sp. Leaf26]
MNDLITITILAAANDNTLLMIIVDEPRQPHWAATGEYDPAMMEAYWSDVALQFG